MIPLKKIPPGRAFLNLPLYSQNLREKWLQLLNDAQTNLLKATELAKNECVYGEFALDMSESSFELAETYYLLSEYRP